jgi:hypothetical protein
MWLSPLFVLCARDVHHAPHLVLATDMAAEHRQQLRQIDGVRLRPPGAPVHLDTRRVHDEIVDARANQIPVNPEPVPSCLVTARHRRISGQVQALLRGRHLLRQAIPGVRWQRASANALPLLRGEADFPLPSSKFDRHQQSVTSACGRLLMLGRGCRHTRSFQNGILERSLTVATHFTSSCAFQPPCILSYGHESGGR